MVLQRSVRGPQANYENLVICVAYSHLKILSALVLVVWLIGGHTE